MTTAKRGLVAKREAILAAARTVFAEYGCERAGVDMIAERASVSTRTIYNHFDSKECLFAHVVAESTGRVADALVGLISEHLDDVADLEKSLIELGTAWVRAKIDNAEHFSLVSHLNSDPAAASEELREAWDRDGPHRVHAAMGRAMGRLAERGLLRVDDPLLAAEHLMALTVGGQVAKVVAGTATVDTERITAGVRAFLYGYAS
ncbi:TetR family transcriptional regulator [Herbihabitans rhizosphaerae]|uniref:TetR family transcriptional regulator n=1 Tax=Herbihabitans rhizosphaerae TaxID=1872711 RepID=A0A4Q7KH74_9PSEU|nr:TetR/AcrR family transcriptional regulator [Herbihabitans rhizosphaerae]RZS34231.1 TetR family transcriptional regulator [Herbihabitans rhizosphaerae]